MDKCKTTAYLHVIITKKYLTNHPPIGLLLPEWKTELINADSIEKLLVF